MSLINASFWWRLLLLFLLVNTSWEADARNNSVLNTDGAKAVQKLDERTQRSNTVRVQFSYGRTVEALSDVEAFTDFLNTLHPNLGVAVTGDWLVLTDKLSNQQYPAFLGWFWSDGNRGILEQYVIKFLLSTTGPGTAVELIGVPPTGYQIQFPEWNGNCPEYQSAVQAVAVENGLDALTAAMEELSLHVHIINKDPLVAETDTATIAFGEEELLIEDYSGIVNFHQHLEAVPGLETELFTRSFQTRPPVHPAAMSSQISGRSVVDRCLWLRNSLSGECLSVPLETFFSDGNLRELKKLVTFLSPFLPVALRKRPRSGFRSPKARSPWWNVQMQYEKFLEVLSPLRTISTTAASTSSTASSARANSSPRVKKRLFVDLTSSSEETGASSSTATGAKEESNCVVAPPAATADSTCSKSSPPSKKRLL